MMYVKVRWSALLMLVLLFVVGCETAPPRPQAATPLPQAAPPQQQTLPRQNQQSPEHVAAATRFLNNIGVGQALLETMKSDMELEAINQPGLAEVAQRSLANVTADDYELIAARVYARHVSMDDLLELDRLTQKPEIKQFFDMAFSAHKTGIPMDEAESMRHFNADEIIEIMKLSMSESFNNMNKIKPKIDRDLARALDAFHEAAIRDYVSQQ